MKQRVFDGTDICFPSFWFSQRFDIILVSIFFVPEALRFHKNLLRFVTQSRPVSLDYVCRVLKRHIDLALRYSCRKFRWRDSRHRNFLHGEAAATARGALGHLATAKRGEDNLRKKKMGTSTQKSTNLCFPPVGAVTGCWLLPLSSYTECDGNRALLPTVTGNRLCSRER